MLERLRMQEVTEIILSVPKGVQIAGTDLGPGEPVMIINKPQLSTLDFKTIMKKSEDGRGFIAASGQMNKLSFTINEGSISYAVWSYLHGTLENNKKVLLKGTEYLDVNDGKINLSAKTEVYNLVLYKNDEGVLTKLFYPQDYEVIVEEGPQGEKNYIIELFDKNIKQCFACYDYEIDDVTVTTIKQINNNIFCTLDVYFDAVDMELDEHKKVCLHCDRVQVFSDLTISINDSQKVSFNPITVCSIAEQDNRGNLNKVIAEFVVM